MMNRYRLPSVHCELSHGEDHAQVYMYLCIILEQNTGLRLYVQYSEVALNVVLTIVDIWTAPYRISRRVAIQGCYIPNLIARLGYSDVWNQRKVISAKPCSANPVP